MEILSKLIQLLRSEVLSFSNQRRLRSGLCRALKEKSSPIFFIFTPEIVHFASYCIPNDAEGFEPILILNSVSAEDEQWLRVTHPDNIIIQLKTSLMGNANSILAHAEVLNDLFATVNKPFCIQDPDCFVTNPGFWEQVNLDLDQDMAGGPFTKKPTDHDHVLPNTFFLIFNQRVFKSVCTRYKISANIMQTLPLRAKKKIQDMGYTNGQCPDSYKGYFDTLQAFWVLALAEGFKFKKISGAGKNVFHIGGTSYLHNSDYDLSHWDYWPLSVIYFNLKLLELPAGERFRHRFKVLFDQFESSDGLLSTYPQFMDTWRFKEMQTILKYIVN